MLNVITCWFQLAVHSTVRLVSLLPQEVRFCSPSPPGGSALGMLAPLPGTSKIPGRKEASLPKSRTNVRSGHSVPTPQDNSCPPEREAGQGGETLARADFTQLLN